MADLDRFFAKKDKKKVKGKKFTTTDEIAKRLEETEKKSDKPTPAKVEPIKRVEEPAVPCQDAAADSVEPEQPEAVQEEVTAVKEEEEWNDFQDEGSGDLSNLKISKLNIEGDEDSRGGAGDADDDRLGGDSDDKKDGVWKVEQKTLQSQICAAVDAGLDQEDDIKATVTAMSNTGSYLAPHLRQRNNASTQGKPGSKRNKTAPDITNEMAFPSLSDSQASSVAQSKQQKKQHQEERGFENVKHGSQQTSSNAYVPPMLRTANRFDALTDHS